MASSDLSFSGLVSGLDTQSIISKMLELNKAPLTAMRSKKDKVQQRANALKDVNTRLSALLTALQKLTTPGTIDAKSAGTDIAAGSPVLLTASAGPSAPVGSFTVRVKQLATATKVSSTGASGANAIGKAVSPNVPLSSAGFVTTPSTGTFTVNGVKVTIDSGTVLSDGSDATGANTIFAKIRDATSSLSADKRVTVSWAPDSSGRNNRLALSATGDIQLGSGGDTSDFLTIAGLASLPSSSTMTGTNNLGGVNSGAYLSSGSANLATPLSATGKFKINGAEISYDTSKDTLSSVLSRINASGAKVTAAFNSATDTVTLTAKDTGSALIDLEDVSGNFLAAMKLSTANETLGDNASYLLNGEQRYSSSNTVTTAVSGVTLSLKKVDATTDVTVTVEQTTGGAANAVEDFIKQYNSAMDLLRTGMAYNKDTKSAGVLLGDSTALIIQSTLTSILNSAGEGLSADYQTLASIGITTGAVGSSVGSTGALVLDTVKFNKALKDNASAVADLFSALGKQTVLRDGGTGSLLSISGTPSNHTSGTYSITSDESGNLVSTFRPADGGAAVVTKGTITAAGINTTLISGVTLAAKGTLVAGTDVITADFSPKGVGVKLADYLTGLTSSTGLFAASQKESDKQIAEMDKQMQKMQDRLDSQQQLLQQKFASLESALSKLQTQSAAITQQLAALNSSSASSRK